MSSAKFKALARDTSEGSGGSVHGAVSTGKAGLVDSSEKYSHVCILTAPRREVRFRPKHQIWVMGAAPGSVLRVLGRIQIWQGISGPRRENVPAMHVTSLLLVQAIILQMSTPADNAVGMVWSQCVLRRACVKRWGMSPSLQSASTPFHTAHSATRSAAHAQSLIWSLSDCGLQDATRHSGIETGKHAPPIMDTILSCSVDWAQLFTVSSFKKCHPSKVAFWTCF